MTDLALWREESKTPNAELEIRGWAAPHGWNRNRVIIGRREIPQSVEVKGPWPGRSSHCSLSPPPFCATVSRPLLSPLPLALHFWLHGSAPFGGASRGSSVKPATRSRSK